MLQKRPVNGFEWVEGLSLFKEDFIKNYHEKNDKGYFLEVDVEYPKNLFDLHRDSPFLPERKKIGKCNKLVCDFNFKKKLCSSHKSFKTSTKLWINTKNVHGVIQFNQKAWLKPYIDMNTELRIKAKSDLKRISLS